MGPAATPPVPSPAAMNTRPGLSLKGRALKHLAAREHSRAELARKLAPYAEDAAAVEAVLDEMQAKGFLSEARYVASVVHRKSERYGVARIRQELISKGAPADATAQAIEGLRETELQRARAVWQRRFGVDAADRREAARQARFLLARGFAAGVVRQVLKDGPDFDDDDGDDGDDAA
jgi:regulatory protein